MSLDTRIDATAATSVRSDGYWEDPRQQTDALGSPTDLNRNALPEAGNSEGPEPLSLLPGADSAITIDGGSSNPSQRSERSTPDGKPIQVDPLHDGDQATIARERTLADAGLGRTYVSSDQLVFTTNGTGNDQVQVSQRTDGTVVVSVNGEEYDVALAERQELTLRVGAGDDTVSTAGGRDDIFGNSGEDTVDAGEGDDVVYGGDGADVLAAGEGTNFIEAGAGDDQVNGSLGINMISAGTGDDHVTSGGDNSIYLGRGTDAVEGATTDDKVYAEDIDAVRFAAGQRDSSQVVVNVEIDGSLGTRGVTVEGSPAFRQRVEAELEFLRSSPNGQQMLAQFDQAAVQGNTVTIRELANEQNGYAQTLGRGSAEIRNGRAGEGSDVIISYNPSFHMAEFPAPVVVLYHEMSHAYNGVTGTFQPGTYRGTGPDSGSVPNAERQAVGLETSAPAFDFDGDPSTAPTTHNPIELTENGLRRELGLPDRPNYTL
jgi:Ca2+-binding RTX toxin-like protein